MEVDRPNSKQLNPQEIQELNRLRAVIEQAVSDGVVTKEEEANIKAIALNPKPSYELLSQELSLYRELVTNKINAGLLKGETFSDF